MEDLFLDFTYSVLMLNKLVQKIKTYEMRKFGLKPIHVTCCYFLAKNGQGLSEKQIAALTLEDKAAVSRAVKILADNGYVRTGSKSRNAKITLTQKGKELSDYIGGRINSAVEAGSMDFSEAERAFFYKSLGEIVCNLKNYYEEINRKIKN